MENQNKEGGDGDSVLNTEITLDFLSSVLGEENEIISYKVTRGSKPGDNFMSVLYAIQVHLKSKNNDDQINNKTLHLLFKCLPSHPGRQEFNAKSNFFYRELQVYQSFLPELMRFQREDLKLPKLYELSFTTALAGKAVDMTSLNGNTSELSGEKVNSLENFILMEDLRKSGFIMPDRRDPLTIEQMRLAIPALAALHALSWVYKVKGTCRNSLVDFNGKFPFFRILDEDGMKAWVDLIETNLNEEVKEIEKKYGEDSEITRGVKKLQKYVKPLGKIFVGKVDENLCYDLMRVKPAQSEFPDPWTTVLHGDCWSGNLLYRYDDSGTPVELKVIDWQMAMEGCLTIDLFGLIYWSTDTEFRKKYLEEMLTLYAKRFEEICNSCSCEVPGGFNLGNLKERFHRGKVVGCIIGLGIYPLILKDDEATVDLEGIDETKDFSEMLESTGGGQEGMSAKVLKRVFDTVQELHGEGVI